MTSPLLMLVAKVSIVLGAALLAARVLRRAPAARQHRLWSGTFLAMVALAPLAATLPALRIPIPAWREPAAVTSVASNTVALTTKAVIAPNAAVQSAASPATSQSETPSFALPSTRQLVVGAWLLGAVIALAAFVASLVRVRRLAASSTALADPRWRDATERIATTLGVRQPVRVLASDDVTTPMAGGIIHQTVFVPADAARWSAERRDVVLAHEIAHLASRDPLRHVVARVALALYWFHPLAWLAARKASSACERACDDIVLTLGIRPSSYARVLLDFAGPAPRRYATAALTMANGTSLETRLMAILNGASRTSNARRSLFPAALLVTLTVSIAAATPSPVVTAQVPARAPIGPAPVAFAPVGPAPVVPTSIATSSVAPAPLATAYAPTLQTRDDCAWEGSDSRSFSGSISTSRNGNTTIIHEQVGTRGGTHVIQKMFGDLRLCAEAVDVRVSRDNDAPPPSDWPSGSRRVVLESRQPGDVRRMLIVNGDLSYTVNGATRSVDQGALEWRDAMLRVLDAAWEVSNLRGQVASKRGEIASIRGQRASLNGEIASARGEVASMRGRIASARGEEASLRGRIASIRGQEASMRGEIGSERGAIATLDASRRYLDGEDRERISARIRRHEDNIIEIERRIREYNGDARVREVEQQIARLDTEGKVAAIEREIRAYDVDSKTSTINRRIDGLDVERRIEAVEREITALDADRRTREIEARMDDALARLRTVLRR